MFCIHCGEKNSENSKFCINCGKPIEVSKKPAPPQQAEPPISRSSVRDSASQRIAEESRGLGGLNIQQIKMVARIGAIIILVCFFMPWTMVSCSLYTDEGVEYSGFEIATHPSDIKSELEYVYFSFGEEGPSSFGVMLFTIMLVAIPVSAAIGIYLLNSPSPNRSTALRVSVGAVACLIIISMMFGSVKSDMEYLGFTMSYRIGYWGTWLGLIAMNFGIYSLPSFPRWGAGRPTRP
jgi:hypothetical protein